ncbi:unnamed protein product [Urochloa decumbens]|uniref:Ubiquitin-like protease family profile domain-containing protein n=1 Tax=Urochloa decumbens TaxID=240449 RepID=A0ABC8VKJ4_9POAL
MDTGQRLVHRMPNNPKIVAFESTQHRFEVPLRPELWSSFAGSGGPVSPPQLHPTPPVGPRSNASADSTGDFTDVPDKGRKKPVRRKRNVSDIHNKDYMHAGGSRRMKKQQPSHRPSNQKNVAADRSRRLTDYFHSSEGLEVPHRPNSGGSRSSIPNARCNPAFGMPNAQFRTPELHIPRMRDLLATQLGFLSGRPLKAFLQMFDQFDLTLSENTRAIQSSLCNIARAPFHLAEQCRPVIDEIIAAQRSSDPNIVGEPSWRNNGLGEDDTADQARNASEHGHRTSSTPSAEYSNDVNREDDGHNTSPTDPIQPSSSCHSEPNSSHDMGRMNPLFDAISDEQHIIHPCVSSHETAPEPDSESPNKVVIKQRPAGKRMIQKPARFCSPFKYGVMSRPPPNVESTLNLLEFLCADNSPLRSSPVIQFGTTPLSGAIVAQSFADSSLSVDPIFMNGFVKCILYDDYFIRPECHGYRIFFDAVLSATLNVESAEGDSSGPKYSESDALAAIRRCLPFTDLKKARLILLPVLHRQHWSVYCVNLGQSRIDVLDSMDYSSDGDNSWDSYHSHMGKTIMQRLSDALSKAAPRKFVSFKNWRHVKVKVPVHKSLYDSAFFAMKFLEFYDGDGHGSLKADIAVDRSKEQRAEMLYYLTFHSENKLHPLPEALLQFRISDHHPFFY